MKNNIGFSLVEMAIVLVIASLIIGASLSIGTAQIASSRILTTKDKEKAIETALISFVARNNRLPCPAEPTLSSTSPNYGVEAATPGTCSSVPSSGTIAVGVIPWVTIGVTEDGATDGYYNHFTYAVSTPATNLNSNTIAGLEGSIGVHSGTPVSTANKINDCTPTGWTYNPCSAVVVILSNGANGYGAYTRDGSRIASSPGADEVENSNDDAEFVVKDFSSSVTNPFDDIVLAVDSNSILAPLLQNNTIKPYSAQLQGKFDIMVGAVVTDALNNRTGISPSHVYHLTSSMPSISATTTTDPWGNTIIYNRSVAVINSSTAEADAFTLRSYGPDGTANNSDDIVETVYVSDLQSKFSTYGW